MVELHVVNAAVVTAVVIGVMTSFAEGVVTHFLNGWGDGYTAVVVRLIVVLIVLWNSCAFALHVLDNKLFE